MGTALLISGIFYLATILGLTALVNWHFKTATAFLLALLYISGLITWIGLVVYLFLI